MPMTAITIFISMLASLISWLFVSQRLKSNPASKTYQARLLALSFLYSVFYGLFMLVPHAFIHSGKFPQLMAVGFVVGHIFLYLTFLQMIRLTFSIVPRLSNKEYIAITIGILAIVVLTAYTAKTMIWGTQPAFDTATGITAFNTRPLVDLGNGLFGVLAAVPAAIIMIVNGVANARLRTRSFLIGTGIIILMIDGPFVESAKNPGTFAAANTISVLGLLILTMGVAYRIDQKLTLSPAKSR